MQSPAKKGLQIQMPDDAIALGVRHAALNVQIGDYLTAEPTTKGELLGGTSLRLDLDALAGLKATTEKLHRAGMKVYAILLARATGNPAIDRHILHPKYESAAPNRLAAFRTTDESGQRLLRAFCRELSVRTPIRGWIVGNEVNSHHDWYNMGPADSADVIESVERSLRTVHEGVAERGGMVYLSLDHFWALRHRPDRPDQSLPGREVLEGVAALARRRGDFGWHVAHHPYPENLFEPRFWLDRTPTLSFDTPRITFKNLEVLTEYLKQPHLLHRGRARRTILSEQGFHRPDGPEGERLQAAAYAYAWKRVARNDGIDAFILHRHVDHSHEGGLKLGLWTNKPGSIADPDRKTQMWDVMKAAGTPGEEEAFRFALPIVGLENWNQAAPQRVPK
ncbi:MAG TPA: DUF5722 domain-containing protein [Fimbriimonadaceae bacterium]|nr:DUF5722 domain-containing protein [Fimbriimonadaceae bacterium]